MSHYLSGKNDLGYQIGIKAFGVEKLAIPEFILK